MAQEPLEGVGLHPKVRNGFLLYPPRPGDGDEPVPSMRWELMWEGLEARTLECLSLLERLVSRSRDEGLKKRALALLYRIKRAFPRFPPGVAARRPTLSPRPFSIRAVEGGDLGLDRGLPLRAKPLREGALPHSFGVIRLWLSSSPPAL